MRAPDTLERGTRELNVGRLVVMPGLVDTHVHVNEPGRTEWEGFASATRAAAAGGITTLVDMPLNSIPATTTVAALTAKVASARGHCWVDVGFLGGVVPGNIESLLPLYAAGVFAFKCFLVDSGVDEFPPVDRDGLEAALGALAGVDAVLMVHAELPGPIGAAKASIAGADPRHYDTFLRSRPAAAEHEAVALVIECCARTGARAHIVHVSSWRSAAMIARARGAGVRVSGETCPHYLTFDAAEIRDGATQFKCAPPIRDVANREALWDALRRDELGVIASDHSPCPPTMKQLDSGDFLAAWGGIASLQLGMAVVWTGMHRRRIPLERIASWMSDAPARLAGLDRKGRIATGYDADVVVWDPEASFDVVDPMLLHRHPVTPYAGRRLDGVVRATYVRGRLAFDGTVPAAEPTGTLLARGRG